MRRRPFFIPLLFVVACSSGSPVEPDDDTPEIVRQFEEHLESTPSDGVIAYVLARYYASKDPDASIRFLSLLQAHGWDGALTDSDFGPFAEDPRYRELAEALETKLLKVGRSEPVLTLDYPPIQSEGMLIDTRTGNFLVGSADDRKVLVIDSGGNVLRKFPDGEKRLLAPLGMEIDYDSGTLWVATAAAPFMADYDEDLAGTSFLAGIDLESGELVQEFPAGSSDRPSMMNDLAILSDGRVAVTDSSRGLVWIADPQTSTLEEAVSADTIHAPNGITMSENGRHLIVASFEGLWTVDIDTGSTSLLQSPPGISLRGIDGLYRDGETLIGIRNVAGRARILRIPVSPELELAEPRVLLSGDDAFENPTTGYPLDGYFYYMTNPGTATRPLEIRRVATAPGLTSR